MKLFYLIIVLFLISTYGYCQKDDSLFFKNELFLKIKPQFANSIRSDNKVVNLISEVPFLSNMLVTEKLKIEKIEKPFLSLKNNDFKNIIKIKISETENIDGLLAKLKAENYYEYIEKVPIRTIISAPNDSLYASQWSLEKIKAWQAWDVNQGTDTVIVAVVDNAIQTTHIDLAANMVAGKDMSSPNDTDPNPPNDTFNHGTHVAGIVSAVNNNSIGIGSAANNRVKIMPIKVTPDDANPRSIFFGFEGIIWAVDNGADIISLSWGGGGFSATEQSVIDYAYQNGVMVVAAAGNENDEEISYPAGYNHVISVASLDQTDIRSSFSSYGITVDISAPGRAILSTLPTNVYGSFSGTSMATPLVSSCLGYLKSCFPLMSNIQIEELLENTADDIYPQNAALVGKLGTGRINLLNAVSCKTQNLDTVSTQISPNSYFCVGDSVLLKVRTITGANFSWFKNGAPLTTGGNEIQVNQAGNYTLLIEKGGCRKNVSFEPLILNAILSPSVNVINSVTSYCSGSNDTLKITSSNCTFSSVYQKNYIGGEIGYDNFVKSGPDPKIEFVAVPGRIDSLEISITWQKKDGGNYNSCNVADGGAIPYNEEVGFQLLGPTGKKISLILAGTYARGTVTGGIITQTFKSSGSLITNLSLPVSGVFKPRDSFSVFENDIPNGVWTLLPVDDSNIDPLCVSGFSVKVYTDINTSVSQTSWWDSFAGGNLLNLGNNLILNNLPIGVNEYFAQNICSGLCPSVRTKSELVVKTVPEILAFKSTDILITETQALEVYSALNYTISKNQNNLYIVSGTNALNQPFSYLISNNGPHYSPVSICDSVSYALIAKGCTGQVQWSNGQTAYGVIIENQKNSLQLSANCLQNWSCVVPPPTNFNFLTATQIVNLQQQTSANTIQKSIGTQIASSQVIKPISTVDYKAANSILLNPGFRVEAGNVFRAQIGNCTN